MTASAYATHLHRDDDPGAPLQIAADIEAETIRAADAWKLRRLTLELVWTMGDGPSQPAADR